MNCGMGGAAAIADNPISSGADNDNIFVTGSLRSEIKQRLRPLARPSRRQYRKNSLVEDKRKHTNRTTTESFFVSCGIQFRALALSAVFLFSYWTHCTAQGIVGIIATLTLIDFFLPILYGRCMKRIDAKGQGTKVTPRDIDVETMRNMVVLQLQACARLAEGDNDPFPSKGEESDAIQPWQDNLSKKDLFDKYLISCMKTVFHWNLRIKTSDVTLWTTAVPGNQWDIVRGRIEINASVEQLVTLLVDIDKRALYDSQFKFAINHKHFYFGPVFPEASLRTLVYGGAWPVADRKFHVISTWAPWYFSASSSRLGAVISSRSVLPISLHNAQLPSLESEHVLAQIHLAGFLIRPSTKNPSHSILTMISHVDFEGNVPAQIINFVQQKVQPDMLRKIRQIAPEETIASKVKEAFQMHHQRINNKKSAQ